MFEDKEAVIEKLTGVKSSKKSYYTELKRTIAELEKKNEKLEILSELSKGFHVHRPLQESLERMFRKLYDVFPVYRVSLSLLEENKMTLQSMYPEKLAPLAPGTVFTKETSLYWKAAKRDLIVLHEYGQAPFEFEEERALAKIGIYYVCIIPLIVKDKVAGVLCLGNKRRVSYEKEDIEFFRQLADHLAVLVENSRLYQAVLQGKDEWEQTFQAVEDVLIVTDEDLKIVQCNLAAERIFNLSYENLIGNSCHDLICREPHRKCPLELKNGLETKNSYRCTLANGRIFDIRSYPLKKTTGSEGSVIYMKDVTETVLSQAQLQHSGKLAAIGEMAAGVAHELNSPLTAILGNTQLLLRKINEEEPEYSLAEGIVRSGKRCQKTIRNLLAFSRLDKEETTLCSLHTAAEDVLGLIGFQIEREQITVLKHYDPALPLVEGSLHQIEQILINLLLNARDALLETNKNRTIEIETGKMSHRGEDGVFLSVVDNGVGMEKGILHSIFDPFFTTKEETDGTGLGLSVSIDLAKTHNGNLFAESQKGRGSKFTFWLPAIKKETVNEYSYN
ncbi:ATP-binding protein [Alteribacillus sp. HJP-4]|uniref:ATP-binding protein n=1 Tax=Alteribacillus sp. HJP-4 TaxID=2775394 RepID=UPI0035CD0F2D